MAIRVERYRHGRPKTACLLGIEIKIERYPNGRLKSVHTSSEQYESWIDENGVFRSMNKDPGFDALLDRVLNREPSIPDCE